MNGLVLEIQRMSTEDGPGLRTTVFLKGCSLRCGWCHNPESINSHREIQWMEQSCIGCGICAGVCTMGVISMENGIPRISRELCAACGMCAEECPAGALSILGKTWKADDLAEELLKDRAYFEESGGGVTISGGEAMLQPDFVRELLAILKNRGIHTALDTCGQFNPSTLERILPLIDLILFDIKEMDEERHRKHTGAGREVIHDNFRRIASSFSEGSGPGEIWIRTPVIPGATDRKENIAAAARFLGDHLPSISRWELCSFNNLCKDKYRRLGRDWSYGSAPLMAKGEMDSLVDSAVAAGFPEKKIMWTGMTRSQEIIHESL